MSNLTKIVDIPFSKTQAGPQTDFVQLLDPELLEQLPTVEFKKISYDRILGDMTNSYLEKHPNVPFHEVIDIIRPLADADYLDQIARNCNTKTD